MDLGRGGDEERRQRARAREERTPRVREPERAEIARRERETPEAKLAEKPGYYGHPVIKPPVWTWQIPLYFFVGGLAGGSAVLSLAALATREGRDLLLTTTWLATSGAFLGAPLLISDLKRPQRFLNMLRVFKWRSPMSMGAWILTAFGIASVTTALVYTLAPWLIENGGLPGGLVLAVVWIGVVAAALLGVMLATYTGVLIGATAVPAWHRHHKLLPVHFGSAGLGSSASALLLFGFEEGGLVAVLVAAALVETALWISTELRSAGAADRAVHEGRSGWTLRTASVLTGPLTLALLVPGWTWPPALAFLVGALASRYGWLWAGRASARDPAATFAAGPRSPPSRHRRAAPRR